jgi:hypothetical protein
MEGTAMVLRKVGVGSAAKLSGAMYAAMGLIAGAFIALFASVGGSMASMVESDESAPAWLGAIFGVGAIVILPVLYGVMGFIVGAIAAAIYNLVAGLVGGLDLDLG